MRWHHLSVVLVGIGIAAGCGGSPSAPSATPAVTTATQGIVSAAVSLALSQAAVVVPSDTPSITLTYPCPDGGSVNMTFSVTGPAQPLEPAGTVVTTSRTEFNDCKSQSVIIRGDPYLVVTGEHVFTPIVESRPLNSTATMHTTGGLRFEGNGVQGRAQYNCTQVVTIDFGSNGTPIVSGTSSGTITWEQPLGTITVRPCGPPAP